MDPNRLMSEADRHEAVPADDVHAWQEIAAGRYMPRRIRGSCRGRVLG